MFDAKVEASFREAIRTAKEQKSVSLEKRGEASYAEYRRRKEVALSQLHCSQIAKKSGWSTFHSDCPNSWVLLTKLESQLTLFWRKLSLAFIGTRFSDLTVLRPPSPPKIKFLLFYISKC